MPLFPAGPLPASHLKEETPKRRDNRVGMKPGAPAATTALSPRFSGHLTTCPPWALVPSHTSAGLVRERQVLLFTLRRESGDALVTGAELG